MNRSFTGTRFLGVLCVLFSLSLLFSASPAQAEGFAIMENSARGMGLAGGLIARGGDPSTLAYNPAAMTLLEGTQMQANLAVSQFYWGVDTRDAAGNNTNYHSAHQTWPIPSFYVTHQINDSLWFGLASFTRFGLGVKYPSEWAGGYNLQSVQLITSSLNPSIAYKFNEHLSLAVGVEMMTASMQMRKNLNQNRMLAGISQMAGLGEPGDLNLNGHGVSFGGNVALHARLNDQWSFGLTYRAPMSLKVNGKTRYDNQLGKTPLGALSPQMLMLQNSRLRGTLHLPDSIGFGVAYKPVENLSFEADAVYTLWSRFRDFNIYMKDPVNAWQNSDRHWRNSWTLGISGEYKPVDWMALRLGFMYETSPMNNGNADYMIPSNGRNYYTAGIGFFYKNWTFDIAYMYIHNHVLDYTLSAANHADVGMVPGRTTHPHAHNFGIGIGYKF